MENAYLFFSVHSLLSCATWLWRGETTCARSMELGTEKGILPPIILGRRGRGISGISSIEKIASKMIENDQTWDLLWDSDGFWSIDKWLNTVDASQWEWLIEVSRKTAIRNHVFVPISCKFSKQFWEGIDVWPTTWAGETNTGRCRPPINPGRLTFLSHRNSWIEWRIAT